MVFAQKIANTLVSDTSTCFFLENLASLFLSLRLPFSAVTHQLLNLVMGHQFLPRRAVILIQASLGFLACQLQLNSCLESSMMMMFIGTETLNIIIIDDSL